MDWKCAICKRERALFELTIPQGEGIEPTTFTTHICSTCWDVIAEVATRAMEDKIAEIEGRLDSISCVVSRNISI